MGEDGVTIRPLRPADVETARAILEHPDVDEWTVLELDLDEWLLRPAEPND